MRIAWATDIHLTFVSEHEASALCRRIRAKEAEALLLGGDIAEARDLETWLLFLEENLKLPVYFVLGNHDYYGEGFREVRERVHKISLLSERLIWLCRGHVQPLTTRTALVGHGCWGDGRLGAGAQSRLQLNDFIHIRELAALTPAQRFAELGRQGDLAAETLDRALSTALPRFAMCVVLTHVPPFVDTFHREGKGTDDDWIAHFTCKAAGDVILRHAQRNPDRHITVLSGHTHVRASARILPNLVVRTAAADYSDPRFESILLVP